MRRLLLGLVLVTLIVGPISSACAGKTPATIAADVAYNGTIVVTALDSIQRFVAAEEAAGRLPRNEAVTAMEAIGRGLTAAKQVPPHLSRLAALSPDTDATTLMGQIQSLLALASSEAAQALVPIGNEATRKQVVALILEVNKAIGILNTQILGGGQ